MIPMVLKRILTQDPSASTLYHPLKEKQELGPGYSSL